MPDGFGHVAQLPQILRGFGIDNAFFWRGLGAEGERLGTEFEWRAPDGSTVMTIWMPWGYHNVANIGYPIHWGDTSQMEFSGDMAQRQISNALEVLKPMANTPALFVDEWDRPCRGRAAHPGDHRPRTLRATKSSSRTARWPSTWRSASAKVKLPEFEGEFRWGRYSEILQGVYASRMHLKQINQRVESLLESYTEPLAVWAWLSGAEVPEGTQDLILTAWRWLLKNHPHDDIYGNGIDPVHDEMLYRFSQAEQIGRFLVRDSLRQFARQADLSAQAGVPVMVFNPLSWERRETAVGDIDFDFDDPTAGDFQLVDGQGLPVPHQVLSDEPAF